MEFLNKWVTRKNLFYVTSVAGILALLSIIIFVALPVSDILAAKTMAAIMMVVAIFYEICLVLNSILVIASAFLYFYKKNKKRLYLVIFIGSLLALVLQLFTMDVVLELQRLVNALLNDNYMIIFNVDYTILGNAEMKMSFCVAAMLINVVLAITFGCLRFISKDTLVDSDNKQENLSGIKEIPAKLKAFINTKKGKVVIASCMGVVIIISVFLFIQANKITEFDATRGCELIVEGDSGEGSAHVENCDLEYDTSNADMAVFASGITYEIKDNGSFANGDSVKAIANYSQERADALKLNVINTELTIKAEGLREYYESLADIDEAILEDADKRINEYVNDTDIIDELNFYNLDDTSDITIDSSELLGKYFLQLDSSWRKNDQIAYLYKITASEEDTSNSEVRYVYILYTPVSSNAIDDAEIDIYNIYGGNDSEEEVMSGIQADFLNYIIEEIK